MQFDEVVLGRRIIRGTMVGITVTGAMTPRHPKR